MINIFTNHSYKININKIIINIRDKDDDYRYIFINFIEMLSNVLHKLNLHLCIKNINVLIYNDEKFLLKKLNKKYSKTF